MTVCGEGGTIEALPFRMTHGGIDALGFRFGRLAYASDVSHMPEESMAALHQLDVLIVDALRHAPHPTHFSVSDALALIARVNPNRAILTNLHTDLDYQTLNGSLPKNVVAAHDGLQLVTIEN